MRIASAFSARFCATLCQRWSTRLSKQRCAKCQRTPATARTQKRSSTKVANVHPSKDVKTTSDMTVAVLPACKQASKAVPMPAQTAEAPKMPVTNHKLGLRPSKAAMVSATSWKSKRLSPEGEEPCFAAVICSMYLCLSASKLQGCFTCN